MRKRTPDPDPAPCRRGDAWKLAAASALLAFAAWITLRPPEEEPPAAEPSVEVVEPCEEEIERSEEPCVEANEDSP